MTTTIQEPTAENTERFPIEMEAMGTDKNHIPLLLCNAHPKMAQGRMLQIFKSITARKIFRRKPAVIRVLEVFWIDGFHVATVGELADRRTLRPAARAIPHRRSPAAPNVLVL